LARITRIFRSSTFRATLLFSGLASLAAVVVLGYVYWSTIGILDREDRGEIDNEIAELAALYGNEGLGSLAQSITNRARGPGGRHTLYLLVDRTGQVISGNISGWPGRSQNGGWISLTITEKSGRTETTIPAQGRAVVFANGYRMFVGRDLSEREQFRRLIEQALVIALGLIIGLTAILGFVTVRSLLRRLDLINTTSQAIFEGALERRIPVTDAGDEFDNLAANLNRMLDRLEQLMGKIREITDNVAHELRTPLNRLRNRLEAVLVGARGTKDYRRAIEKAIADADGLLETFRAMLEIVRIESGLADESMAAVDLMAIADDAADLFEAAADEKGIAFTWTRNGAIEVQGNRHLISQALANLLDNAIKYTPRGGAVALECGRSDGRPYCSVADTGPGIPADQRKRVLDRFVRLEASRTSPGAGLGLGLVRAIADLHHAELQLGDNAPGLRATIRFPAR
jgi:signal transduction histidine kinase